MTFDENGENIVSVTTVLMHDSSSSSPAFFVSLEEEVPETLLVQFPYFLQIGDNVVSIEEAETRNLTTVLRVDMEVLLIEEMMSLTYFAIINPDNVVEGNISKPVNVNYTTIKQEGIGLMVLFLSMLTAQVDLTSGLNPLPTRLYKCHVPRPLFSPSILSIFRAFLCPKSDYMYVSKNR